MLDRERDLTVITHSIPIIRSLALTDRPEVVVIGGALERRTMADVRAARDLATSQPGLGARDLLHLAVCRRYAAGEVLTFDRGLRAALASRR